MADQAFRVDTVPTPRLDLHGALARDLQAARQNGALPPPARSALAAEQEKLNKFLLYVNESFIIKGFSRYNPVPEVAVDADVRTARNAQRLVVEEAETAFARLTLAVRHPSHLYVCWSLCGETTPTQEAGRAELKVRLKLDGSEMGVWRQSLTGGWTSLGASLFLLDRSAGSYAMELAASCTGGSCTVQAGQAYGAGYGKLKTTQTG